MNADELLRKVKTELATLYDQGEAGALAREVLFHLTGLKMPFSETEVLSNEIVIQSEAITIRLKNGEPLQYITGKALFRNLELHVSPAVLIPRPETVELVDLIERETDPAPATIIDFCTGSGCIALALKSIYPAAGVTGSDVSLEALQVARTNSETLKLPLEFLWMDVLSPEFLHENQMKSDLIVSNPPYISQQEMHAMHRNVRDFEPHLALFAPGEDPLVFYRHIAVYASHSLNPGGMLWLEINPLFADETSDILRHMQLQDVRIYEDLSGKDRFISAAAQAS
jgi:release factor glutamine methyltransferase